MRRKVFVSRRLPRVDGQTWPALPADTELSERQADDAIARSELLAAARGASALITFMSDRVDAELLAAAGPQLRLVANFAVGYDNVDVQACAARGVLVANTPDVLTEATAEHAFALLLAVARQVVPGHALVASGSWNGWQPTQLLGKGLAGATLGIVGMGRIGAAVARAAKGFAMQVIYHNRRANPAAEAESGARLASLNELLATSDFVSLHCPLTAETRHLIDAAALARMKPSAVLVNTARGPVIDEAALVAALGSGVIWGAGLDVFEREPLVEAGLRGLPNVVLAPHTGSATEQARGAMARLCLEAVAAVLSGGRPANLVSDVKPG